MDGGDRPVDYPLATNEFGGARSFDVLATVRKWTAKLALELLPETKQPKVEILRGRVIVSPQAGYRHQEVGLELAYRLKQAGKSAGMKAFFEGNVISDDDLFIPDIVVVRGNPGDRTFVSIKDTPLLGEITSPGNRSKDIIDRRSEYASAGVPWYLIVEIKDGKPSIELLGLVDGTYELVSKASSGELFTMTEPFPFQVDPADLLDS